MLSSMMMTSKGILLFKSFLLILPCLVTSIDIDDHILTGVFTAGLTPMKENFELNLEAVDPYMEFLGKAGIDGVMPCSITSEGPSLTFEEKKQTIKAFTEAGQKYDIQVLVAVSGTFYETIELARYAAYLNATAVAALPNFFRPLSNTELLEYLKPIAAAAPNLPFLYYNYPLLTNVNLNMVQLVEQALCCIPNFVGLKTSLRVALEIQASLPITKRQRLIASTEFAEILVFELRLNASFNGLANIIPREANAIYLDIIVGLRPFAAKRQIYFNKIVAAADYNTGYSGQKTYIPALKYLMYLVNNITLGPARPPLPLLGVEKKRVIAQKLRDLDVDFESEE